jgi:PAS domain S-box-containing protein
MPGDTFREGWGRKGRIRTFIGVRAHLVVVDPATRSLSILYVDDDPLILDVVRQMLGHSHGIIVETALSAQEALEKSELVSYDAIVSDYQMPGMNGLDFLKEVRSRSGAVPFILFTGRGREEVAIEAINLGVDFYIQKGAQPDSRFRELADRVRQAIHRRRTEEALQESEERFRELADNSSDLIMFVNADMRFTYISPSFATLTGYQPEEALGRRLDGDSPRFGGVEAMIPVALKLPRGGSTGFFPVTIQANDGKTVVFEMQGSPVFSNGAFRGIQVVGRDVTERKRTEVQINETMERLSCQEELLRAWQRDLEQREARAVRAGISTGFAGGEDAPGPAQGEEGDLIAARRAEAAARAANRSLNSLSTVFRHDVLNSCGLVTGWLALLKEVCTTDAQKEYIAKIEVAGALCRNQAEATREYQGLGSHGPEWFRLSSVAEGSHGIAVRLSEGCEGLELYADPLVGRVFSALFRNAREHGVKATMVTITAGPSGDGLMLAVRDDGVGIASERKERIFSHEYGKDTGFGLFLAREVLSVTGISVRECGTPGSGATFELSVPAGAFRYRDGQERSP